MTDDAPDMTAAELVLGLLESDERAAALRRQLADPVFAAEVEYWRARFAALFAETPAIEPDAGLGARVERSLDAPAAPVVPMRRASWWPAAAGLASLAAAVALVVARPAPTPAPVGAAPMLAAAIAPMGPGAPMSAVYEVRTGMLRMTPVSMADAGHSAELWVIGGDGVPHSLGVLQRGQATAMPVRATDRARIVGTAVLAITIEAAGGSPTGRPSGPPVAKGTLTAT